MTEEIRCGECLSTDETHRAGANPCPALLRAEAGGWYKRSIFDGMGRAERAGMVLVLLLSCSFGWMLGGVIVDACKRTAAATSAQEPEHCQRCNCCTEHCPKDAR